MAIGLAAVANWIVFTILLVKSQTPYGIVFLTSLLTHGLLLLSFLAATVSLILKRGKLPLLSANLLLITLWVVIVYAPSHWLRDWNYGSVRIDGRLTPASVYIGNPTDSEADAIMLVHVPAADDYFLSLGEEKIRVATKREYVRLPGGVWCLRSLLEMKFEEPLPPKQMNEFRIASSKGVIAVQF